jgi:S-(hydroxymethyl)glutathione dehydrogenase/alcohol dehydrogenase
VSAAGERDGRGSARPPSRSGSPAILEAEGVVFLGPGAIEIAAYRVDPPGPGEVRVRMAASGVCHSDLHVLDGDWARPAPLVLGHEGAGWVESVGPEAGGGPSVPAEPDATGAASPGPCRGPRVGDLVVLAWTAPCGRCAACQRGEGWLCVSPAGSGHRRTASEIRIRRPDGTALGAYSGIGTMGSVQVVAAAAAITVDPRTDPAVAALIGCAITTGVGAVTRTARVQPGQTVAVVGLGGVGLAAVLGARFAGARRIVAIDRLPAKLDRAAELGATDLLVAGADPGETAASLRAVQAGWGEGREGVDHAFDASGSIAGIETALAAVRPGGTTTLVGMPPQAARLGLDVYAFVESGARILASNYGSAVPAEIFGELARHAVDGSLPLERLVEERIGLADVVAAFEALRRGDGARRVIVFPPG